MSEHTPGRLYLSDNYAWPEIRTEGDDKLVAVCQGEVRSDARRLVATWNACDGISTETLEHKSVLDAVGKSVEIQKKWRKGRQELANLTRAHEAVIAERDSLRAVNAGLLEASKNALDILTTERQSFVDCNQLRDCRTDDPIAHGLVLVQEDVWITPEDAEALRDYDRALLLLDAAISSARKQGEQG